MTPEHKLVKRVLELEAEIKKNRRNYLQVMKEKDSAIDDMADDIIRLNRDLEIAQNIAAATQAELDAGDKVIADLKKC